MLARSRTRRRERTNDVAASKKFVGVMATDDNRIDPALASASNASVLLVEGDVTIAELVASQLREKRGPRIVIVVASASRRSRDTAKLVLSDDHKLLTGPYGTVRVSPLESAVLGRLLHCGKGVTTREDLRGVMFRVLRHETSDGALRVHIHHLRQKLCTVSNVHLQTVCGHGYMLQYAER